MIVTLDDKGLALDGRSFPLVAGQFEPFRHNPLVWRRCLKVMKEAGLDLVSVFICWDFHELRPGVFDLTGESNPSRDLAGFLDMCAEENMLVLARPGPIIDAEWETRGPAPDINKLDRLHPRFLERARQWIQAVSGVIAPRQATRGGPVVLLAVDNEMLFPYNTSMWQFRQDGDVLIPYDEVYVAQEYRKWLRSQHGTLAKTNTALGTAFRSWDEVHSPRFRESPHAYSMEGFRFLNHQIREWARTCCGMYREAGIEVPTYTNMKQLIGYVDWPAVARELDSVGLDLHMPNDMPGDQALVANWWYRLQSARFPFSWAAEFQAGWIGLDSEYGVISPKHSEYMPMAAQAAGVRGLSFFLFIEREDWTGSPVNAFGKIRPERYERFVRVIRSFKGLKSRDELKADVGLIWTLEGHQALYIHADRDWSTIFEHAWAVDEPKELPSWWTTFRTLCDSDVDFRLWVPGLSNEHLPRVVIFAGPPTASSETVAAMRMVVSNSSYLVAVTPLPFLDELGSSSPDIVAARSSIMADGHFVEARMEDLPVLVGILGARTYARSGQAGVWTYLYEDEDGALVLGVWNSTDRDYMGPVQISRETVGDGRWLVQEPRLGTETAVSAGEVAEFGVTLVPHTARVFRLIRRSD